MPHLTSSASASSSAEERDLLLSADLFAPPPPSLSRGPLHPGSVWEGLQRSGRNSYKVRVNIDTVDLEEGTVSGLLQIQHLTPELESLVTFFEGEIIGTKAGFRTARWGATEADDMKHWSRFPAFTKGLRMGMKGVKGNFKHMNKPFLFMRWKEQFVVPSSHAQNIHGASFAGFYYLCLECDTVPSATSSLSPTSSTFEPRSPPSCGLSLPPPSSRPTIPQRHPSGATSGVGLGLAIAEERSQGQVQGRSRSHTSASSNSNNSTALSTSPPAIVAQAATAASPRRASSFSYAAAVRGAISPPLPPSTSPPSIPATEASTAPGGGASTGAATPKEPYSSTPSLSSSQAEQDPMDAFARLHLSSNAAGAFASPSPSPSALPSTSGVGAVRIPTPSGMAEEDFPPPPVSPPLRGGGGGGSRTATPSSSAPSGSGSRWPLPSPSSSSTPAGQHLQYPHQQQRERHRRPSLPTTSSSSSKIPDRAEESFGLSSYTQYTLSGYYYYRNSEPYQELQLRYVPGGGCSAVGEGESAAAMGAMGAGRRGGSEGFEFR